MAERALDRIDVRPAYTVENAAAYEARFAGVPAPEMLRTLLTGELHGQIAAVSSFGTESAVLLHMVAQADPATPVVFTDTLKMFPETLSTLIPPLAYASLATSCALPSALPLDLGLRRGGDNS